jgi:hypothetical protein
MRYLMLNKKERMVKERFKVRPESAPVLKGECARLFSRRLELPLTQKQLQIYVEADKVYNAIKPRKK